jgi:hypothetical protein
MVLLVGNIMTLEPCKSVVSEAFVLQVLVWDVLQVQVLACKLSLALHHDVLPRCTTELVHIYLST